MASFGPATEAPEPTEASRPLLAILMFLQIIAGLFGNSVILRMFYKFDELRTPGNRILIYLTLAEVGICCCIPFSAISVLSGRWVFGRVGCSMYGFLSMFFGLAVIGLLMFFSIDRYLVFCRKSYAPALITHTNYSYVIVASFASAVIWAAMPLFGWASYVDNGPSGCAIDWTQGDASYISYLIAVFTSSFVIPITVMIACYSSVYRNMKKGHEEIDDNTATASDTDYVPMTRGRDWHGQQQFTNLGIALVFIFLITWSPFAVLFIWGAVGDAALVPPFLTNAAPLAAKFSPALNSLALVIFIKRFRKLSRDILLCSRPSDVQTD